MAGPGTRGWGGEVEGILCRDGGQRKELSRGTQGPSTKREWVENRQCVNVSSVSFALVGSLAGG